MNKDNQPKKTEQSAKTGKKSGKGRRVGRTIGIVLGTILLVTVLTSAIFVDKLFIAHSRATQIFQ